MTSAPSGAPRKTGVPRAVVWVLAVVAVLALAAAAVTGYLAYKRRDDALAGFKRPEQAAIDAARTEMLRIQTFRRASFDADVQAALDGMTADQGAQITAGKKDLLKTLTDNKFDTTAHVLSAGLISYDQKNTAVVLVAVDSLQTDDKGTVLVTKPGAYQMTMTQTGNKWLMSDLHPVTFG